MAKLGKATRVEIYQEFCARHKGIFDPKVFLEEVRRKGKRHPAFDWFVWDDNEAAEAYRLSQARSFVSDLRISFEIKTISAPRGMVVRTTTAPLALSPISSRLSGGGYIGFDPNNVEHQRELARQASIALRHFRERYEAALLRSGIPLQDVDRMIGTLDEATATVSVAAE